jgi:hypothetical protein
MKSWNGCTVTVVWLLVVGISSVIAFNTFKFSPLNFLKKYRKKNFAYRI